MGLHNLMKTFKPNIATLILTALTILKLIILLYLIRCVYYFFQKQSKTFKQKTTEIRVNL